MTAVYLFSNDLRLGDHPGLALASKSFKAICPVFIFDDATGPWAIGGASRWWLHHSLVALSQSIKKAGGELLVFKGDKVKILNQITHDLSATAVFASESLDAPFDESLVRVPTHRVRCNSVISPRLSLNKEGRPYQVFTSFWRAALPELDLNLTGQFCGAFTNQKIKGSCSVDDLKLLPKLDWDKSFKNLWKPGEAGALKRVNELGDKIATYDTNRDLPSVDGTSFLSPHLHFGEVHPARIFEAIKSRRSASADRFRAELGWREFARSLMGHFPHTANEPLRKEFKRFPWESNEAHFKAWTRGQTGYPIVDAGMRQLWTTGWMHNRVRMIVASFLTKDLRISWLKGAEWFWDTLVDADLPSNTLGWQWAAGCGADAAPYFRVFNPTLQGQKFDPKGEYVKTWVPELKNVDAKSIHSPWLMGSLFKPKDYPDPIVDHAAERLNALKAFESLKSI